MKIMPQVLGETLCHVYHNSPCMHGMCILWQIKRAYYNYIISIYFRRNDLPSIESLISPTASSSQQQGWASLLLYNNTWQWFHVHACMHHIIISGRMIYQTLVHQWLAQLHLHQIKYDLHLRELITSAYAHNYSNIIIIIICSLTHACMHAVHLSSEKDEKYLHIGNSYCNGCMHIYMYALSRSYIVYYYAEFSLYVGVLSRQDCTIYWVS